MADGILNPIEQLEAEFDFDVYTKQEVDTLLDGKADKVDTYTKTETDALLNEKADASDVYTKTETNNLLSVKANSADVYTKTEIDNQLTVTKNGTWVKGTQTTAVNLEKLEGGIEYLYGLLSYKYSQLRKYINGNYYDYETDTDSAYTKTAPNGAMPYAGLEQLGGKTLAWNQLGDFGTVVWESGNKGVAFTQGTPIYAGHKYYFCGTITSETNVDVRLYTRQNDTNRIEGRIYRDTPATIFTATNDGVSNGAQASVNGNIWLYMNVSSGDSATNIMLIDLTLMFGSGNEPTTVEEFRAMFPADYYPYNAGQLLSAGVTEVVSKKADTTTIATYPVPSEIKSLDGYGWSAGSVYNYIDYERKVFVQNVFRATFNGTTDGVFAGGVSIGQSGTNNPILSFRLPSNSPYVHKTENNYTLHNAICDSCPQATYNQVSYNQAETGAKTTSFAVQGNWNVGFAFYVPSLSTLAEYQTYLASNPLTLQWELATPIETDISAYITDDNLISVESGGTLTFENQHGDDYRIPVPSTEEYMIDLQEAVSNG